MNPKFPNKNLHQEYFRFVEELPAISPYPAGEFSTSVFELFTWTDLREAAEYVRQNHPDNRTQKLVETRLAFARFRRLTEPTNKYKSPQDVADALKVITPDRVNSKLHYQEAKTKLGEYMKTASLSNAAFFQDLELALRFTFQKIWKWMLFWQQNPNRVSFD